MKEQWKSIPETNGKYSISSHGRVRSHAGINPRILRVHKSNQAGDLGATLRVNNTNRKIYIAKEVARAFLGVEPSHWVTIIHADGDRSNNNVENLVVVERKRH